MFSPRWCTDGTRDQARADVGTVVVEQERVIALSPAARAAGVQLGMRRASAVLRLPEARVLTRSLALEEETLQAVALALLQYTPQVARAEEASLLLDIGASLRLFGGIRRLRARLRATLAALGLSACISYAPTARGAWLLARQGGACALSMDSLGRQLDRLPLSLILPARSFMSWFDALGCTRIDALRRLPRPGLQRRCGKELLVWLDAAYGMGPELFDWIEAPAHFEAKLELFDRIEQADLLLAGAQRLVEQMVGWLCAHQLAVERIALLLQHERGRVACPPTELAIMLGEPQWKAEHILRLLRERLGRLALAAPVIGLQLDARQLQPLAAPSESLFPEPGGSEQDRVRMIELLIARLGAENVLQALPVADHRPEVANAWVPVQPAASIGRRPQIVPPELRLDMRPVWLLTKPIALLMREQRPFYGSPLRIVSRAERIEAGWWSASAARDYFVAEGQDHALYYVYRERVAGEDGVRRWYLQGLFG